MKNSSYRRTPSMLMELLIIITVFALCCAAGLKAIAAADSELTYSEKLSVSAALAADIAEQYKAGTYSVTDKAEISEGGADKIFKAEEDNSLTVELDEYLSDDGYVHYLKIRVSDEKYVYTELVCARTAGGVGNA